MLGFPRRPSSQTPPAPSAPAHPSPTTASTPAMAAAADVAPRAASVYLDPSYWSERAVRVGGALQVVQGLLHFHHLLAPLLPPSLSVLEVGCGNSRLGEELLQEGVAGGVTCVDLSPVAVQRMRDRLARQGTKGVEVVVADMIDRPFEQFSFDLVIEKGTMDVLFVDSGDPWNPNPTTVNNFMKMLEGIHRVLKPEGHTFDGDSLKLLDLLGILSTTPLAMASIIYSTPLRSVINYRAFVLTLQWLDTYFCNISFGSCCSFNACCSSLHRLAYFRNHLRASLSNGCHYTAAHLPSGAQVATYNKDYSHCARGVVGLGFLVIYLLFSRSEESSQGVVS
ncbi:hypothetical protein ACP4OV_001236 [Aristida adscensionis]